MTLPDLKTALSEIRCRCGGTLTVQDHNAHNQWRYEVYCQKCHTCDPNGWGSRTQALKAAREFFV